ncbi:DUF7557 family protein [Methanogenium organophilum]|uniref:Uncharacterized protein n=1 Tax=Methanogenium organophilum TaxID=2199 RepID=A0A9X9S7B9_METOG|nr:hypothetical protein [Methanogenium organophilum]WAI02180.1 hypothetical protein OU421_04725 [Methanogenium organophilum]
MHRSPDPRSEPNARPGAEPASVTIDITPHTRERLDALKESPDESYDAVISRLCDRAANDTSLRGETLQEIEQSLAELRRGISRTHEEIVQELAFKKEK